MCERHNRALVRLFHYILLSMLLVSCFPQNGKTAEITKVPLLFTVSPFVTKIPTGSHTAESSPTKTLLPTSESISPSNNRKPFDFPTQSPTLSDKLPRSLVTLGKADHYIPSGQPAFSPGNQFIVLARDWVGIWDAVTYDLIFEFDIPYDNYFAADIAFSSEADFIAVSFICWPTYSECSIHHETHLMIWELNSGNLVHDWTLPRAYMTSHNHDYFISVYGLSFKPESNLLAYSNGNTVELKDVTNDNDPVVLDLGEEMYASEISYSDDGRYLIVLMEWDQWIGFPSEWASKFRVQVWDTAFNLLRRDIDYPEAGWFDEDMSLTGSYLAHSDKVSAAFTVTDLITEDTTLFPYRKGLRFVSPDRNLVAFARFGFGYEDGEKGIELWNSDTWREIYHFAPNYVTNAFFRGDISLVIAPDNSLMLIAHNGQLSLWDIRSDVDQ